MKIPVKTKIINLTSIKLKNCLLNSIHNDSVAQTKQFCKKSINYSRFQQRGWIWRTVLRTIALLRRALRRSPLWLAIPHAQLNQLLFRSIGT